MYNANHFIQKFSPIPENKWCVNKYGINLEKDFSIPVKLLGVTLYRKRETKIVGFAYCAQGHCLTNATINYVMEAQKVFTRNQIAKSYPEWNALIQLFDTHLKIDVADVNNGRSAVYQQPTPKQRILKALEDIRELEYKSVGDVIINKALSSVE